MIDMVQDFVRWARANNEPDELVKEYIEGAYDVEDRPFDASESLSDRIEDYKTYKQQVGH